jgi:uncharacterized protein (TIGR02001 family)
MNMIAEAWVRRWTAAALGVLAGMAATPAAAQVAIGGGFTVSGNATVTTDYRFRGLSQSGRDPAVQGGVTLDHASGLFGGVFASSLSDSARPGKVELDAYLGYGREIASGTNAEVGVQLYTFPDSSGAGSTYVEPYASVRHTLGPVTAEVGAMYAPKQDAFGGDDSLYVYGDLRGGIPFTPVTVTARVGYTSGPARFAPVADYLDWRVGAQYRRGRFTLGVDYVDTDAAGLANARGGLVGSVRVGF